MTTLRIRDERGSNQSIAVVMIVPAVILMVGLVVDGGRQLAATQQAEAAADGAAQAGLNAAAGQALGGKPSPAVAQRVAREYLARTGVGGSVTVSGTNLVVTTSTTRSTQYLSLVGVPTVTGVGSATVSLAGKG